MAAARARSSGRPHRAREQGPPLGQLAREGEVHLGRQPLAALGPTHELKSHVLGALNNGVTPVKLQEVFLHASVYCGFPAAVDALRAAAEVVESTSRRQATHGEDEGRSLRLT